MEGIQDKKLEIRNEISNILGAIPKNELTQKTKQVEDRLFEFANFLESKISLLYINTDNEVNTKLIINRCFDKNRVVVLPAFNEERHEMALLKIDNVETDLILGARGVLEPNADHCKTVPIENIDIAIIPGIAFDEKGGRIGTGSGFYDRLIPKLSITTRKVALALECKLIQQIPMESHDKHVDIIITEKRIIYKI
jgi:5-formyltetrahydrofolate cyclo-ligase